MLLALSWGNEGEQFSDIVMERLPNEDRAAVENREQLEITAAEQVILHVLTEHGQFQLASEYEHRRKDMAYNEPLDGASIVRLLDPMPEQLLIDEELEKNKKIGKALVNLHPPFDLESLRRGGVPNVSYAERQLAKRFARELTDDHTLWPRWLK